MSRKVLILDGDAARRAQLAETVRELGAEPLEAEAPGRAASRLLREAQVVVGAGDDGVEFLARLALDRPSLPRIALLAGELDAGELVALVERVHPWAVVPGSLDARARLQSALRDALAASPEGMATTELTARVLSPAPDFASLIVDRLTGADGYQYATLRLEEELERAARYGRPLSLALIDLDDLRGLNDRYGRAAGDFALQQVASALAAGARSVDRVARWAGGGFALVLPETAGGAAYGIAERLRADIAARRLSTTLDGGRAVSRLRVTVSCGVACTVHDGVSRPTTLVQRADGALWRAKQGGRNRSVVDG
ncbi:MAG TPA: GGDEF domain-containing protein [Polyangia bacterium]|nr:GGDEF domain-containing protein [Polyangia bacterium]